MRNQELIELVDDLLKEGKELSWLEFKEGNATDNQRLGKYISALSNAANLAHRPYGYLIFGIKDGSLEIVGTKFSYENRKEKGSDLDFYIRHNLSPSVYFEHFVCNYQGKKIEIFRIPKSFNTPIEFEKVAWIRIGSSLTELKKYPEYHRKILLSHTDWSAEIVEEATIDDLDEKAIQKAKQLYKEKNVNRPFYEEIDLWTNTTFLDRLNVTIGGKITNTALILLGKESAAHFISPKVAQITWKLDTEEKAYQHFGMPLFLTVNAVLERIRNIPYRFFPDNQLISVEVPKYDNKVILEALNNCIAHQDYFLNSRIVVTEKINKLIFENAGDFFEGKAEDYFFGDKTPKYYRNKFLVNAMVNLNMIDSVGYGIYKMLLSQKKRYFPLPDHSKSTDKEVVLEIYGHYIDENYSKKLIEQGDLLELTDVILIDKVQKKQPIDNNAIKRLKQKHLIEGRKPQFYISEEVATILDEKAEYTLNKGLDNEILETFILKHINTHGFATRKEIDTLLLNKLPNYLSAQQKKRRLSNMIQDLKERKLIENVGTRSLPKWIKVVKE
ncbi:RNA-binding domain-containing protein [Capnocytophaga leadbetteri]|uniref:RNA-binding domain-containing protein n=1 Tax=Capnocytophaga leadbetteri TaxID=327575 RepID=UPI0028EE8639|nr:RNA-binding domain-containing protein [Capnocytophaga leadbetteri]